MIATENLSVVDMKLDGRRLTIFLMVLVALIQGACGIQVTASGDGNGESGSVSMTFDTLKSTSVNSQIAVSGATITPSTAIVGPIPKFEWTHGVTDTSGKSARVYVKVINAPLGLTYSSKVLPKEGSVAIQTQVSAEQWLTVPKADSIQCTAYSSYGTTRSASVGLEEYKGTAAGDYVTLTGYYGKAVTTGTTVLASQTATSGAADSIKIYGTSKDSSGTYTVNTPLKGISGGKATFAGLSETSSSGTTTQVVQTKHVHGTFISTATYKPITGTTKTTTRNSNYGTDYDLTMVAKKYATGPSVWGALGYYVNPTMKIQGAVNAALTGDIINVAAGTYKENVKIDKSLAIKGAGSTKTIVDGNKAGSVFSVGTVNPNVNVALYGMKIQNGLTSNGGGIFNKAKLTVSDSTLSGNSASYGGGIFNQGTATISGNTLSGNSAYMGGGIYNMGTATVSSSTLSGNLAKNYNWGGGICNFFGTVTVTNSVLSGNSAGVGGGIFNYGTATIAGSTLSGNSAYSGGGIYNSGTAAALTVSSSRISGNSAIYNALYGGGTGGGIFNEAAAATVSSSIISGNYASNDGGGIWNGYSDGHLYIGGTSQITNNQATTGYGGGIYSYYGDVTFDGTVVVVNNNRAHVPATLRPGTLWYQQYGVYSTDVPTTKNGFNPATQVTGNTHI